MSAGTAFTTIRTEGAILPPDILNRIAAGDKDLGGLTEAAYHLTGEKFGEATNRAWNRLQAAWLNFQTAREKLAESDPGTSVTRERWLLPLFQLLDYGRLQTAKTEEVGGKQYAVSHAWQHTPIHLVGCNVELDRRIQSGASGLRSSPHSLVQELLNRSDQHLWGIVSNGLRLRLLRDNISLTRQAYVEFDLEAMMAGEAYPDFVLLWLILHQSRFEAERPDLCQLEKWSQAARTEGVRVLDGLRDGVQRAIEHLGQGFLVHPANTALRENLRSGALDKQDYYRQILRLVYRLLFLFVGDDRDLLLVPTADPAARKRYLDFYASSRLRQLASTRARSRHHDLYCGLKLVMEKLSGDGCPALALPALGSFLFSARALPNLNTCDIANLHLLEAVHSLAVTQTGHSRRSVDYRNLGAEELGSVYESLLELHPELNAEAGTFELKVSPGSERKTTGSYYTPTSLISRLLDSALNPVLESAVQQPNAEAAILKLRIVDPACGSGHFLIAAAHRLAKGLATVRTGEEEPPPQAQHRALRDVIGHCIYGVDVNPMAVELCKVSLWMEALEPGKPLSFLEHRIQCGNSLLGTTPSLLAEGIPDEAFTPMEGDDKEICREFKKVNKDERARQMRLFAATTEPWQQLGNFAASLMNLDQVGDDSIDGVREKERLYEQAVRSGDYLDGRLWADAWCAAFVWKKTREFNYPITEEVFRRIERNPHACEPWMRQEIERLAGQYRFFHWHLAFPDVFHIAPAGGKAENEQTGWQSGFDLALGNPPWEKVKLSEKEWFANRHPEITRAVNSAARKRLIESLKSDDPHLYKSFLEAIRQASGEGYLIRNTKKYPLCGQGDTNTFAVFAELMRSIISPQGRVGCIVPSGLATDDSTKEFFRSLIESEALHSLYCFENEDFIFPAVHHSFKFGLLTIAGTARRHTSADLAFYAREVSELDNPERHFRLTAADLRLLNPASGTCPVFRSERDAEITKAIYRRLPVFVDLVSESGNPWRTQFLTMFHMSNDSGLFRTQQQLVEEGWRLEGNSFHKDDKRYLPLYEGKMVDGYNHRYASVIVNMESDLRKTLPMEHGIADWQQSGFYNLPLYWIPEGEAERVTGGRKFEGRLAYKRVTQATSERTFKSCIIPWCGTGDKLPLFAGLTARASLLLLTNFNSFVLDFVARQKTGYVNLAQFVVVQLPVLTPAHFSECPPWDRSMQLQEWTLNRAIELTFTSGDLSGFARECGYDGPPFAWSPERRTILRCELDAAYFHLYGVPRQDIEHIMDSFNIVKRKDEHDFGEYRTKRLILEIYDAMAEAARSGVAYRTRLELTPGKSAVRS